MINKIVVKKIWAVSLFTRVMWVECNGVVCGCRITNEFYDELKKLGIPTCQKLRSKKGKK